METNFAVLVRDYLDETFRLDPIAATRAGIHAYDHAWPDFSEAGRLAAIESVQEWRRTFEGLAAGPLSFDDRIDRDRLLEVLEGSRHALVERREDAWNPLSWIYLLGDGLFGLLAREFAPVPERLTSVAARLEGLPAVVDAACATIGSVADRPVSAFHTERALLDVTGIPNLIEEALTLAGSLPPSTEVSSLRDRLEDAAGVALEAVGRFESFLRDEVLPGATGDGRLGAERFAEKLARTVDDPEMTVAHILEAAERLFGLERPST